jgi:8-oxo-dGTP pyrophosphatase MutT (NUDIX family)
MEICDLYDASGTCTGKTAARGTTLQPGEYYLVVQVWIRNEAGEYLIQQRALDLVSSPGMWATTAGYVHTGEESMFGAVREVEEELGITLLPPCLSRFARLTMENRLEHIWLAEVTRESLGVPMLGDEVAAWKWASKPEIRQMIKLGQFFAYSYFDMLPE